MSGCWVWWESELLVRWEGVISRVISRSAGGKVGCQSGNKCVWSQIECESAVFVTFTSSMEPRVVPTSTGSRGASILLSSTTTTTSHLIKLHSIPHFRRSKETRRLLPPLSISQYHFIPTLFCNWLVLTAIPEIHQRGPSYIGDVLLVCLQHTFPLPLEVQFGFMLFRSLKALGRFGDLGVEVARNSWIATQTWDDGVGLKNQPCGQASLPSGLIID